MCYSWTGVYNTQCIIRPGYSSVSDHKQIWDYAITRQKTLQNYFFTRHLYSAQNIRNINTGSSKILESRITEYAELDGIHQDHWVQLLALHKTAPRVTPGAWDCCPKASWTLVMLGAVTTSLGSLFLCPTTLWVKILSPKYPPKSSLTQLHVVSSSPVTGHRSEDIGTCPFTSSHEDVEDPSEISPQSSPGYFIL